MKLPWFRRIGIFFIPNSIIGLIIMLSGIGYAVYEFIYIDHRSHSASDTLRNFFFHFLIIVALYNLIALLTSRSKKG